MYTKDDLLKLAKRHHNTKRTYLLVDPLQGKHIPVSPTKALDMMGALGAKLRDAYPDTDLVIGFAETATAVAAVAAHSLGRPAFFLSTTREPFAAVEDHIEFREEHSHAVGQYLMTGELEKHIECARRIALIDDELSTGRTLLNIIGSLTEVYPALREKPMIAVSIISRLTEARKALLKAAGADDLSLLELPMEDLTQAVAHYEIRAAEAPERAGSFELVPFPVPCPDLRRGDGIDKAWEMLEAQSEALADFFEAKLCGKRVVVLGTEECMLPGLLFGRELERRGLAASVRFHATTRSPICLCDEADYPIRSGARLESFYEAGRATYLYDLEPCDAVVVLTDSGDEGQIRRAASGLSGAFAALGCESFTVVRG